MAANNIADTLENEIVAGHILPGDELKQGLLADRFSVSRIPIRDALQILAARGLVDLTPNRRARVIQLSPREIHEIFDLRVLLETDCLRYAIRQLSREDMQEIELAHARSAVDAGTPRWAEGDWGFHAALYRPANRPRQLAMIEDLRRTCRIHIAGYVGQLPSKTNEWLKDHENLVAACQQRSEYSAISILSDHIGAAAETLLAALPKQVGG